MNKQFGQAKPKDPKAVFFIDDPKLKGIYFDPRKPKEAARIHTELTDPRTADNKQATVDYDINKVNAAWNSMLRAKRTDDAE